jgi:drug/metabolite transporter (DMT)-like permease
VAVTTADEPTAGRGIQPATPLAVWSAMWVVYLVWGSTYLAIAVAVESMPPLISLGTRFLTACAVLGLVLVLRRGPRALAVPWPELRGAVVVGVLLLGVGMGVLTLAEQHVPSGVAALIVAVMPLWVVILRAVTGDRPPLVTWLGVAVGICGVVVLVGPGSSSGGSDQRLFWSVAMLGSTACWAFGSFLQPKIRTPRDPLLLSFYEMLTGGVALGVVGLLRGERFADMAEASTRSWWGWAYLVVVGSLFAYTAFVWLVGHAPLSLVSTYAYVNPVVAVLLGWWILDEAITPGLLVGGAIVVLGVMLVVSAERLARRRAGDAVEDAAAAEARAQEALLTEESQAER